MIPTSLAPFACPGCRASYDFLPLPGAEGPGPYGVLACTGCGVAVPVAAGFPCFDAAFLRGDALPWADAAALGRDVLGEPAAYRAFLADPRRRGRFDAYAAFEPFNEAGRALLPLLPVLRAAVRPGDVIVDVACRTGWTGEWLAGQFPEQHVIALWEGDLDVLGHAGFRHWLPEGSRAPNLTIAFAPADHPLPLASGVAAAVVGLDVLHRRAPAPFLAEAFRVARPDAVLAFPHVHLANGEPAPYFARGGTLRHGRDYRAHFDRALAADARRAFVLAEPALFAAGRDGLVLRDDADTPHYNGCVLVADRTWEGRALPPAPRERAADAWVVPSPLLGADAVDGAVGPVPGALGDQGAALLARHPCYAARLAEAAGARLGDAARRVLLAAEGGATVGALPARTALAPAAVAAALDRLEDLELVRVARISGAMARLQRDHATRDAGENWPDHHFGASWAGLAARFGDRPVLVAADGSAFGVEEATALVDALRAWYRARGLTRGDRVALWADNHVEAIAAVWAAWLEGLVAAPLDADAPGAAVAALLDRLRPALLLVDEAQAAALPAGRRADAVLDPVGDPAAPERPDHLAAVLAPWLGGPALPPVALAEADPALVLFTSGTTGAPKGVVLTQGALHRSGRLLAGNYGWGPADVLAGLGGLHAMSGLRNPAVAAVGHGVTSLVLPRAAREQPLAALQAAREHGATILTAVPAFLQRVALAGDRARAVRPLALRQVLVTGATAPAPAVRAEARALLGAPIHDYYGLTETCGACVLQPPGDEADGAIGRPVGAIAALLDPAGRPVAPGEPGELCLHGPNLMAGYLDDPQATAARLRDGWLRTGDLARVGPDGALVLLGRLDDQVKGAHGEILHPEEVARDLAGHPGVAEAAVVAFEDEHRDQRLAAFVVPRGDGGDALVAALREAVAARLGRHKVPSRFVLLDALPRGSNGKVQVLRLEEEFLRGRHPAR